MFDIGNAYRQFARKADLIKVFVVQSQEHV